MQRLITHMITHGGGMYAEAARSLPGSPLVVDDVPQVVFCQEFFDGLQTLKKHTLQAFWL